MQLGEPAGTFETELWPQSDQIVVVCYCGNVRLKEHACFYQVAAAPGWEMFGRVLLRMYCSMTLVLEKLRKST